MSRRYACLSTGLLVAVLLAGCASRPPPIEARYRTVSVTESTRPATYLGAPLQTGQIVVGESGGAFSMLFSLFAEEFSPYVHAGILVFEDGRPILYEARGQVALVTGEVPTDSIRGRIHRRHLSRFLNRQNYVSIYDPPAGVDRQAVADFVRAQYAAGLEFDPYFNTRDHSQVYCTEFVAMALEAGGAAPPRLTPVRDNHSLNVVREWLKIDGGPIIQAESMLEPERRVVTISRKLTPNQLQLYQAAKREIYQRFTRDQRLGNLFSWTGSVLRFRPTVNQYLKRAIKVLPGRQLITADEAAFAAEKLAMDMFGPYRHTMAQSIRR